MKQIAEWFQSVAPLLTASITIVTGLTLFSVRQIENRIDRFEKKLDIMSDQNSRDHQSFEGRISTLEEFKRNTQRWKNE